MDIGIIGGADGSTEIFVTAGTSLYVIATIVIICITVVGIIILKIRKGKSKQ